MTQPTDPKLARQFAHDVVLRLRGAGYEALWAGGCVRDQCLGLTPRDYDVATDARPTQIRALFGYRQTLAIGEAFGVVTVLGPRKAGQIEIATFRRDEGYTDGRHPDKVAYSTAQEDAQRRDFTINGLFYDPVGENTIDYVGGQADLVAKRIRCIGDPHQRIDEDKLRMLRAVRFATNLGFEVDEETQWAIQQHADEISCVSAERIAAEMRRTVQDLNRAAGLKLLRSLGLWRVILPEYASRQEPLASQLWQQMETVAGRIASDDFPTVMAGVLWPVAQLGNDGPDAIVEQLSARWRLSNDELKQMTWLLEKEGIVRRGQQVEWPTLQRVLIHPLIRKLLLLSRAVALCVDGNDEQVAYSEGRLELPSDQLNPTPLIDGHDLRQAGVPGGPVFGVILESVRNAQLEGKIQTHADAMSLAKSIWKATA